MRRFQLDEEAGIETDSLEYSREFRNFWKAETDAALAAIERVKETLSLHNPNGRLVKEVLAALDGAPEPEWEYAHREGGRVYDEPSTPLAAAKILNSQPVRRRKAGPWPPVEGESTDA